MPLWYKASFENGPVYVMNFSEFMFSYRSHLIDIIQNFCQINKKRFFEFNELKIWL